MSQQCNNCDNPKSKNKAGYCDNCYLAYDHYRALYTGYERDFISDYRFVYFIEHPVENRIKIGITMHLNDRLSDISSQEGVRCKYLGFQIGGKGQEYNLHGMFSDLSIYKKFPSGWEWFRDKPLLRDYIEYHSYNRKKVESIFYYKWLEYIAPLKPTFPDEWSYLFNRFQRLYGSNVERAIKRPFWVSGDISLSEYMGEQPLRHLLNLASKVS